MQGVNVIPATSSLGNTCTTKDLENISIWSHGHRCHSFPANFLVVAKYLVTRSLLYLVSPFPVKIPVSQHALQTQG